MARRLLASGHEVTVFHVESVTRIYRRMSIFSMVIETALCSSRVASSSRVDDTVSLIAKRPEGRGCLDAYHLHKTALVLPMTLHSHGSLVGLDAKHLGSVKSSHRAPPNTLVGTPVQFVTA
jgi:hypothetical protein